MCSAQGDGFVGRLAELGVLEAALARARQGRPAIIAVEGEAGVGKTALMRTFLADNHDVTQLWASGDETEVSLKFGLVNQLRAAMASEDLQAWPPDGSSTRVDTFAVGAELLKDIGELEESGTLAIVIDDLHWVDQASSRALLFWMRRLRRDCVLVLLAMRPRAIDRLGDSWAHLMADTGSCRRVRLGGLTSNEVGLLAETGGRFLPAPAVERLRAHTGGNPLYVEALLEELPEGALQDLSTRLPAPHSYASTVLSRVSRLSVQGRDLVAAAAVIGVRCPTRIATTMAGLVDPLPPLEDVLGRGVLGRSVRGGTEELFFPHPLMRAAVYDDLSAGRRRALHLAAAELMTTISTALSHRVAAAAGLDVELAAELAAAADAEVREGALQTAAEHLIWSSRLEPAAGLAEARLLRAVELLMISGDVAGAHGHLTAIEGCAESAHKRYILAALTASTGNLVEAQRQLRAVVEAVPANGDTDLLGRAAASLALVATMTGHEPEAIRWASTALAATPDQPTVNAIARQALGLSLAKCGRAEESLALFTGLSRGRDESAPFEAELLATRGVVTTWTGDPQNAVEDLRTVVRWANAGSTLTSVPNVYATLAEAEYGIGAWDDAITHVELGVSLGQDLDHSWNLAYAHCVATNLYASRGDAGFAAGHATAAQLATQSSPQPLALAFARVAEANVAWACADWDGVLEALRPMPEELAGLIVNHPGLTGWLLREAEALVRSGRPEEAADLLDQLRNRPAGVGPARRDHVRLRGLVLFECGDVPAALASLDAELRAAGAAPQPFADAQLGLTYGQCLISAGRRPSAVAPLKASRVILAGLRARLFVTACDAALAACGVNLGDGPEQSLDGLTSKEIVVARLVARGLTNREVAGELYLSTKAIEYHLANIFIKLGIHSRRQLRSMVSADPAAGASEPSPHSAKSTP